MTQCLKTKKKKKLKKNQDFLSTILKGEQAASESRNVSAKITDYQRAKIGGPSICRQPFSMSSTRRML